MTDEHDDIRRRLEDAFERRASSMSVHPPTIDELVGRSQPQSRRLLAGATLTVLAVGAVGIVALAGAGDHSPAQDALPEPMPAEQPTTTILVLGGTAAWQCTGPLGTSPDGAVAYYESCSPGGDAAPILATTTEPVIGLADCAPAAEAVATTTTVPAAPHTTQGAEAVTTTTNPDPCIVNAPTVPAPATTYLPDPTTTVVPPIVGATYYIVNMGDYPVMIAEKFCTTIAELVVLNGWNAIEDFTGLPGTAIIVADQEGVVPDSGTNCPDPLS